MAKVNKPAAQNPKQAPTSPKSAELKKTDPKTASSLSSTPATAPKSTQEARGKKSGKNNRPAIGGTAVQGARSTQPREITATNPSQQQAESYNRDMRRRMQHLGTNTSTPTSSGQRRLERRKKRMEERQQEVKKTLSGAPRRITIGRRNTIFLIGVVAALILIIVLFLIIRHPF